MSDGADSPDASPAAPVPETPDVAQELEHRLTRRDYRIIIAITSVAFLLRLLSPILPDFATNPTSWPPVRAFGLGHPYQAPSGGSGS